MCGLSVYFLKKTMDGVLRSLLLSGAFSAKLEKIALSTPICIPGVVKGKGLPSQQQLCLPGERLEPP